MSIEFLCSWINFVGEKYLNYVKKYPLVSNYALFNIYRLLKWVAHKFDGLSQVERLCLGFVDRTWEKTVMAIYVQLILSERLRGPLDDMLNDDLEDVLKSIMSIKKISDNSKTVRILKLSIVLYRALKFRQITEASSEEVKWENDGMTCTSIYEAIFPKDGELQPEPNASGKEGMNWVSLGFQGNDPSTDFRNTGKFGLGCYYSFCINGTAVARQLVVESGSYNGDLKRPWYPFALVSIHISSFLMEEVIEDTSFVPLKALALSAMSAIQEQITKYLLADMSDGSMADMIAFTLEKQLYSLHSSLLQGFHRHWQNDVITGKVKTVLDCECCLERYKILCSIK
ncbi:hypothetical protein TRICI_000373 [Trichomonascus ciferrii]|uniref:ELMO domain-containing protein n=1 Tax=Trichomonascus ciferrii TaxID=44093 RepID=A0A642VDQ1_9ASCO|nr:hypothetical protein TRICI_000373 [Trichomonascus ciferrii]